MAMLKPWRIVAGIVLVGLLAGVGLWSPPAPASDGTLTLQAPAFVQVAEASNNTPEAPQATPNFAEAGIAAYFKKNGNVGLDAVRDSGLYRTIEDQEANYIIGSVQIENYDATYDVHVYISTDGWVVAFLLKSDPLAKVIDHQAYDGGTEVPLTLDAALARAATVLSIEMPTPTYYHFAYPNANRMTLVADKSNGITSFSFTLPTGFEYYEYSYSIVSYRFNTDLYLDGERIQDNMPRSHMWSTFDIADISLNTEHSLTIDSYSGYEYPSIALGVVYKEQ